MQLLAVRESYLAQAAQVLLRNVPQKQFQRSIHVYWRKVVVVVLDYFDFIEQLDFYGRRSGNRNGVSAFDRHGSLPAADFLRASRMAGDNVLSSNFASAQS